MMKRKTYVCPNQLELPLSCDDPAPVHEPPAQEMAVAAPEIPAPADDQQAGKHCEPHLWCDDGWTARVTRSEDGEGWAVEMVRDGDAEPVLVAPWTAGRDGASPRELDAMAFATLVKTASDLRRRHEQQLHALLHKSVVLSTGTQSVTVTLDIVPDEDLPHAILAAYDEGGTQLAQVRVAPTFRLSKASAAAWLEKVWE